MRQLLLPVARPPRPAFVPVRRRPLMSQGIVDLRPQVNAPISVQFGLGQLPLSLGMFAGSAASFLIGSQVPSAKGITNVLGIGLAILGVGNLLLGDLKPAEAAPGAPVPTTAPGQSPVTAHQVVPTLEDAFAAVSGRIVTPENFTTMDVSAFGTAEIPVRVRLENPSSSPASFDLIMELTEIPTYAPIGTEGDPVISSKTMQVTIPPGQTVDIDTTIPSGAPTVAVDFVEATLLIKKRRLSGGNPNNLYSSSFVLE